MPLEIIGAGFGRTGTKSLKLALERLGFGPCHHMFEVHEDDEQLPFWQAAARGESLDFDKVYKRYRSAVDWPSVRYWRELAAHYPDAKIILSTRTPDSWIESVHKTIGKVMATWPELPASRRRDILEMAAKIIIEDTFDGRLADKDHAISVFGRMRRRSAPRSRLSG